jgi:hypothetical protein
MSANERKHVRTHSTRGFVAAPDHEGRKGLYVRKGWHLEACPGEAHSPEVGGMIDNCTLCAPLWGCIAVADVVDDATANAVADKHVGPPKSSLFDVLAASAKVDAVALDVETLQRAAEIVARVAKTRDGAHCVVELMRCVARLRGAQ